MGAKMPQRNSRTPTTTRRRHNGTRVGMVTHHMEEGQDMTGGTPNLMPGLAGAPRRDQ